MLFPTLLYGLFFCVFFLVAGESRKLKQLQNSLASFKLSSFPLLPPPEFSLVDHPE